ncbi:hypothetical protein [uncultured Peptoniphilus sp.]|uniref:hypothetical protein n=1 Tax=uncultured Peptoniphilus sp. TaxID=254354 RepID=UPI0025DE27EB|nr:hypothetical protein [uncultured Peptoniphilus sp.]
MKNKLKYILILIILIGSIPILPVLEDNFYGFFAFINFHGLSSFVLPLLISLPLIYKNRNFYFFYVFLIPVLYNNFFIIYFFKLVDYSFTSIIFFVLGLVLSLYLLKVNKKNSLRGVKIILYNNPLRRCKSKMDYETQVKMFKHLIPIGERDSKDLIDYLKNKFDIVEINFSELPSYKRDMLRESAKHSLGNIKLNVEIKDMSFRYFKIIENEKSIEYVDPREAEYGNFLFLVLEEKTKYMSSNSGKLLIEMTYVSGVSEESYLEEDDVFKNLLSFLMFDYLYDNKFLYEKIIHKKINR